MEQSTHITVGRSIFIDTKHRLARVYITNPEIRRLVYGQPEPGGGDGEEGRRDDGDPVG